MPNEIDAPWLEKKVEQGKMQRRAHAAGTKLEYLSALDINSVPSEVRHTKIVCTIGPSSKDVHTLDLLLEAGMDIARLNFAHGTSDDHSRMIRNIREAVSNISKKYSRIYNLAIAVDIKGPAIRTGLLKGDVQELHLKKGEIITLSTNISWAQKGTTECVYIDDDAILQVLKTGDEIHLDHGRVSLIVKEVKTDAVVCEIKNDGVLGSEKMVNVPGIKINIPAITQKDKDDIDQAKIHKVDMIFASYIRDGKTVEDIKELLGDKKRLIKVIAKIQDQEGLDHIDEIIEKADGILLARGSLGTDIPLQKIFVAQKSILAKCNVKAKPAICATDMLETMTHAVRPTAAEISDVANAVFDGADCIMLSAATATGSRATECLAMLSNICLEAESACYSVQTCADLDALMLTPADPTLALALAVVEAAQRAYAVAIILPTDRETTAERMAHLRPRSPIVVVTRYGSVARHLRLCRGVIPLFYIITAESDFSKDMDARTQYGITHGKTRGFIKPDDAVILVSEWHESATTINTIRVVYASHTEGL